MQLDLMSNRRTERKAHHLKSCQIMPKYTSICPPTHTYFRSPVFSPELSGIPPVSRSHTQGGEGGGGVWPGRAAGYCSWVLLPVCSLAIPGIHDWAKGAVPVGKCVLAEYHTERA